jgi:hypothetical protein
MIPEDEIKTIWPLGFGKPVYLQDTDDHDKMARDHKDLDSSFLGHLVPLTKYIRVLTDVEVTNKKLDPSRAWVVYSHAVAYSFQGALEALKTAGVPDNNYYAELSNPKAKYTRGIVKPNSSLWKEFAGFNLQKLPKVLLKFGQMTVKENVTIHSTGMEGSGSAGLVYNEKLYESCITLEGSALKEYANGGSAFLSFQRLGEIASDVSSKLFYAVLSYAKDLYGSKYDCEPYTEEASRIYWHNLDKEAHQYVRRILAGDPTAEKGWNSLCLETAEDIVRDIKDGSVRRNKAVAKALKKLV